MWLSLLAIAVIGVVLAFRDESSQIRQAREAARHRDFPHALELFKAALGDSGGNADALLFAARTARRGEQYGVADQYLRRYSTSSGSDAEIFAIERILVGIQRGELNQIGGGLQFCQKNPEHPAVPFVLEAMAQGYLRAGHLVGTLACVERWLATNPPPTDQAQARLWRGHCYQTIGNLEAAKSEANAARQLAPDWPPPHKLLAELLTSSDPATAITHWEAFAKASPNSPDVSLGLARCHRNLGESAQALPLVEAVLKQSPTDITALLERAKLYLDLKAYPRTIEDAQAVLRNDPKSRPAMTILAQAYQATGRDAEAQQLRQSVKGIEETLYQKIREEVAAGRLPPPPKGTDPTVPELP